MTRTLCAAALALMVAGCGGGTARVKGRVVENGQPVSLPPTSAALEFVPLGPDGQPEPARLFTAVVNEDGTFEVVASGGQLPVGSYQITFRAYGALAAKYRGKGPGPVRREFKPGQNELTIDLAKPDG